MYKCFRCFQFFNNVDVLIRHLKHMHLLSNRDILQCEQNKCKQIFSNFSSLKRHLLTHKNINYSLQTPTEIPVTSSGIKLDEPILSEPIIVTMPDTISQFHINREQTIADLQNKSLAFCLQLYSKSTMPRKDVLNIQSIVSDLLGTVSATIRNIISNSNSNLCTGLQNDLDCILNFCNDPFMEIKSEHRIITVLKAMNLYESPKSFVILNEIADTVVRGNPTLDSKMLSIQIMPLKFQFKALFELPNVLQMTLANTEKFLADTNFANFSNGQIFHSIKLKFDSQLVIPYVLYFDDFQINNALGSHTFSICGSYYNFPTMPQYILSKLDFIFNAAFISTKDLKCCGNRTSFYHLLEELKSLEEGILIQSCDQTFKVHFVLGLVVGDNLGVNSILGFVQSFNAKRYCRACITTKDQIKIDVSENEQLLRTRIQYEDDLSNNTFQDTGVKTVCIFNELRSFHVTNNICFDIMHDVLEGICVYDICNIILGLVNDKVISLDTINSRKKFFQFGNIEIGNISQPLLMDRLQSNNLKMTASEVWCFTNFLPLMIGDLISPDVKHWKLLVLLIEIVDLLFDSSFSTFDLDKLQNVIKTHHQLYILLYGDLKPKHHFLVHYPSAIKKCGPLKFVWAMRFEAKHKDAKIYFNNITSRLNPAYTAAMKSSFCFSNFLQKYKNGFPHPFNTETFITKDLTKEEYFPIILNFENINYQSVNVSTIIHYKGIEYKQNYFLASLNEINCCIYKIKLFIYENEIIYVLCYPIEIIKFDEHFQSYETGVTQNCLKLINISYFTTLPMNLHQINNGKTYARLKKI